MITMETQFENAARTLLTSLRNNDDKSLIFEGWKSLALLINRYDSYKEIPYCPEVPMAMFLYVMNYSSKRAEENAIRAITTFGVLMNGVKQGNPSEGLKCMMCLSLLLSFYKKHFQNVNNFDVFPITKPVITEYITETVKDYGNTKARFDAIKLYVISVFEKYGNKDKLDSKLVHDFELDTLKFMEEFQKETYDKTQMPNGLEVLNECYERMDIVGKCPIYYSSPINTEIFNKTYGLLPNDVSFNINSFFLHETIGTMMEGPLEARINMSVSENSLIIATSGIDEDYLRSAMSLPLKEVYVRKVSQYIELTFDVRISKWGNIDNVPMSMNIRFEHFKAKEIDLNFIIGAKGYMRTLSLYGSMVK